MIILGNIIDLLETILENTDEKNPIKIAHDNKLKYYNDFIEVLDILNKYLSKNGIKDLLNNKLLLNKKYDEPHYLQAVSEINLLYYVLRKYNNGFKYEPKYNGKKNPECSFKYKDKLINIEVKCPDLTSKIESEKRKTTKLYIPERTEQYKQIINDLKNMSDEIEVVKRYDNKLKDYLVSASSKFPESSKEHFNILVISLDIIQDLDEWYTYIFGNEGVFTSESFVPRKNYKNVDAILLTNFMNGHTRYNHEDYHNINLWELEQYTNILLLDPSKEHSEKGHFYFYDALNMFGQTTSDFLLFQKNLDDDNEKRENKIISNNINYINDKMIGLSIISNFVHYLENNSK